MGGHGTDGAQSSTSASWRTPSAAIQTRPRARLGEQRDHDREGERGGRDLRIGPEDVAERREHGARVLALDDTEVADPVASEREASSRQARDRRSRVDTHGGVERAPPRAPRGLHRQRQQRDQAEWGQEWPRHEGKRGAGVPPGHGEPGEREDAVDDSGGLRDVPEREDRRSECDREPDARGAEAHEAGRDRDQREERRRPER